MSVALVTQHAMGMRLIVLPSVARPAVQYFPTLSHNRQDFRGGGLLYRKSAFSFSVQFLARKIYHTKNLARYFINVYRSSCDISVLVRFMNL